jgi:uncharacterized membrane protein
MTTGQLLAKLFNLNQHTDALNSAQAATDFWVLAGVALCIAVAVAILLSGRHHGTHTS